MTNKGDILGGAYVVEGFLGAGGTARVYLARHKESGQQYAIKEIPAEGRGPAIKEIPAEGRGPASKEIPGPSSMLAELRVREKLHHPALPHVWTAWEENGFIYVVMDYVRGVPLSELLKEQGAAPPEQAVEWAKQLCRALVYLHGFQPPVIYRDMKPANVILQEDGKVKLVDFGAIRQMRRGRDTMPLGTPGYAAPEQYGKRPRSDVRSDVYALGVTLYQMLTGHDPSLPPYEICDVREWNKNLPATLARIVRKCTAKQPWRRYQSCEELLKALETYSDKSLKNRLFTFFS